jgi:hypothetical protein
VDQPRRSLRKTVLPDRRASRSIGERLGANELARPMHGSRRHVGETGNPDLASAPAYSLGQLVAAGADLPLRCR